MTDADGHYRGIVATAVAYRPDLDDASAVSDLATLGDVSLSPATGIPEILQLFDEASADELAVVDEQGRVIGVVTEKHARRRYFDEVEASQRELFGEG